MRRQLAYYLLDIRGEPVEVPLRVWAHWMEQMRGSGLLQVRRDWVGELDIRTFYLGAGDRRLPRLWVTQCKGHGSMQGVEERYRSRAEAAIGHELLVGAARRAKVDMAEGGR